MYDLLGHRPAWLLGYRPIWPLAPAEPGVEGDVQQVQGAEHQEFLADLDRQHADRLPRPVDPSRRAHGERDVAEAEQVEADDEHPVDRPGHALVAAEHL